MTRVSEHPRRLMGGAQDMIAVAVMMRFRQRFLMRGRRGDLLVGEEALGVEAEVEGGVEAGVGVAGGPGSAEE